MTDRPLIIDGFAGPGGWDQGLAELDGVDADLLGIELDDDACATGRAAGHARLQGDMSALAPAEVAAGRRVAGVIQSPPCQAWSSAGKQLGELDRADCHRLADRMANGDDSTDWRVWEDPRSPLIAQPVRWVRDLAPEWIALEEVPQVLPFWEHIASIFRRWGYQVWTGILCAADYGVPQTRRRAFLMAHRGRPVHPPMPTHSRVPSLLTQSWVSMADALGWGLDAPSATVSGGGTEAGGGVEVFANADYRRQLVGFPRRNDRPDGGDYRARDLHSTDGPAPAITEKARSMTRLTVGNQTNATVRTIDEPAPTLLFGYRLNAVRWSLDRRTNSKNAGGLYPTPPVGSDRPAPTVTGNARLWTTDRPATTVQGDPRIGPPGHKDRAGGVPQFGEGTVRIELHEAAVLQSFPADYPWQGSRTSGFRQCGNAVPPRLAAHVLAALGVGTLPEAWR